MALVLKDRVKETSVSTGTGAIALDGATGAYQAFSTIGNGNTTYYCIAGQTTNEWEVGIGTYTTSTDTLSRDTILASSNSGSIVTFSAGTKDVFITYPSEKGLWVDASGTSNYAATIGSTAVNLGATVTTLAGLTSVTVTQDPSVALDLATKQYVDGLVSSGITFHDPVKYEVPDATGNLTATYNNGTSGVGATLTNAGTQVAFTPDGVVASVNDRVLVYNQTNATQNGVYTVTTVGSGSTNWVLTRATDADSYGLKDPNALGNGDAFFVTSGNTGAGETYVCNTPGVITFGTTNITFAQITSSQVYNAGTGLTLSPATTFNIANTAVTPASYGAASKTLTATVNAQGQLTALADANIAIAMSQVTSGTLGATQGGTGQSSYSIGDILYADTTTSLARLADVATGNALISGGLNAPPAWGKIALASAVSGTLGIANGGTGQTTANAAFNALAPSQTANSGKYLTTDGTNTSWATVASGGTFSAGTTGFTPSSPTSGAVTLAGTLNIANGGTGETTRQAAMDALAGATTSGQYLRGNGTDVVMASIVAGDVPTLNQNTTGNAATATVLQTARTIGGVSFNGSANIDLPGVNTAGNQNTSGNAATATTASATTAALTAGTYLTSGGTFNGSTARTFAVDATTTNTASKVVARDASGNFSAGTITAALSGNASTATTATNQSGGTVSATTGSFSGQVTGKSSGTDATPSFYAVTSGSSYASMWNRRGSPFTSTVSQSGSSYAPTVSMIYSHNAGWGGVYSLGVLNEGGANPGAFNIHHLNDGGGQSFAWQFQGSTGNFSSPGNVNLGTSAAAAATATPSQLNTGLSWSNGTTRDKCKIYLYNSGTEQYGFSVGSTSDVQYHSNGFHDFYINNTKVGSFGSGGLTATLLGNAATATTLSGDQSNWASLRSNAVANMLGWKNYGNNHIIFDASGSSAPSGAGVNNTNAQIAWSATYPTLMGWNGSNTYGVRVDSARASDTTTRLAGDIYISPSNSNTLNGAFGSASDSGDMWINYRGFNDGFSYFRTFNIGNGKGTQIAGFDGPTGNFLFNSGYGSPATAYGCRAWVNFNGQGTVAIRASGNVSSITDNGVGRYAINFTSAMPDTNYNCVGSCSSVSGRGQAALMVNETSGYSVPPTTTSTTVLTYHDAGGQIDPQWVMASIFR